MSSSSVIRFVRLGAGDISLVAVPHINSLPRNSDRPGQP